MQFGSSLCLFFVQRSESSWNNSLTAKPVFKVHFQSGHSYASSMKETFGSLICALCLGQTYAVVGQQATKTRQKDTFDKPVFRDVFSDKGGNCNI